MVLERLWWLPKVFSHQYVLCCSLLGDLVRVADLFFGQDVKCLNKFCRMTLLNNFADLLVEVDGFEFV